MSVLFSATAYLNMLLLSRAEAGDMNAAVSLSPDTLKERDVNKALLTDSSSTSSRNNKSDRKKKSSWYNVCFVWCLSWFSYVICVYAIFLFVSILLCTLFMCGAARYLRLRTNRGVKNSRDYSRTSETRSWL